MANVDCSDLPRLDFIKIDQDALPARSIAHRYKTIRPASMSRPFATAVCAPAEFA